MTIFMAAVGKSLTTMQRCTEENYYYDDTQALGHLIYSNKDNQHNVQFFFSLLLSSYLLLLRRPEFITHPYVIYYYR